VASILARDEVLDVEIARATTDDRVAGELGSLDRALSETAATLTKLTSALAKAPAIVQDRILAEMELHAAHERALMTERAGVVASQEQRASIVQRVTALRERVRAKLIDPNALTYEQKRLALTALGITVLVWPRGHEPRYVVQASLPDALAQVVYPSCLHPIGSSP
jgi:site-specific DNA recombinase